MEEIEGGFGKGELTRNEKKKKKNLWHMDDEVSSSIFNLSAIDC